MIEILDPASDEILLPILERRPEWSAYALCDLDPPYRAHARFVGATENGQPTAAVLFYRLPGIHSLLPFGSAAGIAAVVAGMVDPPVSIFFLAEEEHLSAIETRYDIVEHWSMSRMCVRARAVTVPERHRLRVARLEDRDVVAILALYDHWGDTPFEPEMLGHGIYVGAWDGDRLVAVAGTHAVSRVRQIAAIGGVFTHPEYRCQGLATAVTGSVCQMLADLNIDLVVLNVRSDNAAAIRAYTRLGFANRLSYREGRAEAR